MTTAMAAGHRARYWHRLDDGRLQCDLCPRTCRLRDGQRGFCFVRSREGEELVLDAYGRSSGFCIDPIEKKPLFHFSPGGSVLSFGTAGCCLNCRFCSNWDISRSRDLDLLSNQASPEAIARVAQERGCRGVAFTYNDPVIFAEYAMDVADACHARGLLAVAVTAGYLQDEARRDFFATMDAANVDVKGFRDQSYFKLTGTHLRPVLDTLVHLKHETDVWLEISTVLIPGFNDSDGELTAMCRWLASELGPDVPLHFSAFRPDHKMLDVPPTPASTLVRARDIARQQGLHFVYSGGPERAGSSTHCPGCHAALIERDGHAIRRYRLAPDGHCPDCGTHVAGRFPPRAGDFGDRTIPVAIEGGSPEVVPNPGGRRPVGSHCG